MHSRSIYAQEILLGGQRPGGWLFALGPLALVTQKRGYGDTVQKEAYKRV
jgi:hypothetical protein